MAIAIAPDYEPLHERLETLQSRLLSYRDRYEQQRDSRAVFTHVYATITGLIRDNLAHYEFHDPAWVVILAEQFAEKYFIALDVRDGGGKLSAAWAHVFDILAKKRTSVLEDLVFAMTAHIVHDLPLALLDARQAAGDGTSHIYDFHRMNDLLGRHVEAITNAVSKRYSPLVAWLDHLGGSFDQILTGYGFRISRGVAWYNATRILDPGSEEHARKAIVKSTIVFVENVRRPKLWPLRLLFRVGRWISSFFRRWPARSL
jgi:hypothetical protein